MDIAEEFKYIVKTSFNDIQKDELDSLVRVGREVVEASKGFAQETSDNDERWRQRIHIEKGCVDKYLMKLDAERDARLIGFLKNDSNMFYLSSCRVTAMNEAKGRKNVLEQMKKSVRRIGTN